MQSLAQFTHILGMLALFAALVVEWTAVELLRTRDATRTSFLAASLLAVSCPGLLVSLWL